MCAVKVKAIAVTAPENRFTCIAFCGKSEPQAIVIRMPVTYAAVVWIPFRICGIKAGAYGSDPEQQFIVAFVNTFPQLCVTLIETITDLRIVQHTPDIGKFPAGHCLEFEFIQKWTHLCPVGKKIFNLKAVEQVHRHQVFPANGIQVQGAVAPGFQVFQKLLSIRFRRRFIVAKEVFQQFRCHRVIRLCRQGMED